jgi:hypothetical protein
MLLNLILLLAVILAIILLLRQLRKPNVDKYILPICKFLITNPQFHIDGSERIAKYSVISKIKNRYFRDFPIGFKFYSEDKFRSKIRITYTVPEDDEVEVIYDRMLEFQDNVKEHIYYINDLIVGQINIEIYTDSQYGKPTILFELLQSNMCHMDKEHKLEIKFPE